MVLIRVRAQRRKDRRVHIGERIREHWLISHVHQCLIGVVVQEFLDVFRQTQWIVNIVGVCHLVIVEILQHIVGKLFEFCRAFWRLVFHVALILVTDVVAVDRFVTDNQSDQVSGVGQTCL